MNDPDETSALSDIACAAKALAIALLWLLGVAAFAASILLCCSLVVWTWRHLGALPTLALPPVLVIAYAIAVRAVGRSVSRRHGPDIRVCESCLWPMGNHSRGSHSNGCWIDCLLAFVGLFGLIPYLLFLLFIILGTGDGIVELLKWDWS